MNTYLIALVENNGENQTVRGMMVGNTEAQIGGGERVR